MQATDSPIRPPHVHAEFVIGKCDYFVDVHLWPRRTRLDPQRWLSNFSDAEQEYAVHLLNAFLYFSTDLVNEMFKAAFQRLSREVVAQDGPFIQAESRWKQFRQNLIVTYVTGETPSETDSGYSFVRKARQELGIAESNIMAPERALQFLVDHGPRPVVFVDDFVGSGDQFFATWRREYDLDDGNTASFYQFSGLRGASFYYCPVFCTESGHKVIHRNCPGLVLSPAHFLPDRYGALNPDSVVWPDHLRRSATDFLISASRRAGIADEDIGGHQGLGLTIAFEHGVPDATLPIFYYEQNGWNPLVRRT